MRSESASSTAEMLIQRKRETLCMCRYPLDVSIAFEKRPGHRIHQRRRRRVAHKALRQFGGDEARCGRLMRQHLQRGLTLALPVLVEDPPQHCLVSRFVPRFAEDETSTLSRLFQRPP